MSEANKTQVAGDHYRTTNIPQHWDIVIAMGWDYLVGNATKYIWRLGKKHPSLEGQLQDIDKAIHYLTKKREVLVAEIEAEHQYELSLIVEESEAGPGYVNQDR